MSTGRATTPRTTRHHLRWGRFAKVYRENDLSGQISTSGGMPIAGPVTGSWTGRSKPHRKDRAWVQAWSPEQIANRIRLDFPDDESVRISHEAIYQALYIQGRGALKRELILCLRTGSALRAPRARSRRKTWAHVTTRQELRIAIVTWIEKTYHRRSRQASLSRLTPVEYETVMTTQALQAA